MAKLLEVLPIINLWKWADGNEYTIDDDSTELTPELSESDAKTDKAYNERYRQQPKRGNAGKGKKSKFKEENKVEKEQLNKEVKKVSERAEQQEIDKEIVD